VYPTNPFATTGGSFPGAFYLGQKGQEFGVLLVELFLEDSVEAWRPS